MKNISAIAAGKVNAALDCDKNLYTWYPQALSSSSAKINKENHGSLTDICIGNGEVGLARDRNDNLYEWGYA